MTNTKSTGSWIELKIDTKRCDELLARWTKEKKDVPSLEEMKLSFWVDLRNRCMAELERDHEGDMLDRGDRKAALRASIRELTGAIQTYHLAMEGRPVRTQTQLERSQRAYELTKPIADDILREWLIDLRTLEITIRSGHVLAKKYRKLYFRWLQARDDLRRALN